MVKTIEVYLQPAPLPSASSPTVLAGFASPSVVPAASPKVSPEEAKLLQTLIHQLKHDTNEKATLAAARAAFTRIQSASNALPSVIETHKFNSAAADRWRQVAPSNCACVKCGMQSKQSPRHFQQMERLCDECFTAEYAATEEELTE